MKLATWNVNSLKVRLPQVIDWLQTNQPDMLCLQETKLSDENFPAAEIAAIGYESVFIGQKTYNGVAILSKQKGSEIITAIPGFEDEQKRVVAATYGDVRVISVYVPNGDTVESEKYQYKLRWLPALTGWLRQELKNHQKLAILGDFNIAPEDRDVYDPQLWQGKVLCSQPERAAFGDLLQLGLTDSFRLFEQAEKSYTWWDYRMMAFRLNRGLRIDHILLSNALASVCTSCTVDKAIRKLERPSDHAPVVAELTA
ncbi:exodeoxyribonuclease III [Nitrosomonas oligotropha]|uniref:Exodeoxyribonuclease III n=1 Tax=Nitrosomonas oligotropha TaxID=42354 RepID=A0A1H8MJ61_9PROT|nr:exodeoxyribonuclease III [Nitrosomonas oligotropha]SDW45650.1 Exodeoxyribonuclease III [Nitrosomonas oligotropha]SEO17314.1 Exodeoxyribonuclease III [Nitrosomonas oligotropha]